MFLDAHGNIVFAASVDGMAWVAFSVWFFCVSFAFADLSMSLEGCASSCCVWCFLLWGIQGRAVSQCAWKPVVRSFFRLAFLAPNELFTCHSSGLQLGCLNMSEVYCRSYEIIVCMCNFGVGGAWGAACKLKKLFDAHAAHHNSPGIRARDHAL